MYVSDMQNLRRIYIEHPLGKQVAVMDVANLFPGLMRLINVVLPGVHLQ
jgi:hypothetical protein